MARPMSKGAPRDRPPWERRRARRRYAATALLCALALIAAGFLLIHSGDKPLGDASLGYGIGVLVAAGFLASGWEPPNRR